MLKLINKRHLKAMADRLYDLDEFRVEKQMDGLTRVQETNKMQVDSLTFKRAALSDQMNRGKLLDRSSTDARHDVRKRASKWRSRTHRENLSKSEVFAKLDRMKSILKREGRYDKLAVEFFERCKGLIAQGTALDQTYLFRLIRTNSEVNAAVQEFIDVLLCELQVGLPGYLSWCMVHQLNHEKARIDDVLDVREEQRKRKRRKYYIAGKDFVDVRRKQRLVVKESEQDATPFDSVDHTFLTQAHQGAHTARNPSDPAATQVGRRAEPKGKERWRQSLSPRLRSVAVQRKRMTLTDKFG